MWTPLMSSEILYRPTCPLQSDRQPARQPEAVRSEMMFRVTRFSQTVRQPEAVRPRPMGQLPTLQKG